MATRGMIARQINSKEVEYLYSHWDNYIEHNGIILCEHYNTKEKVEELFSYNKGISSLSKSIEETRFYEESDGVKIAKFSSLNECADHCWAEYIYIFTLKGEWKYKELLSYLKEDDSYGFVWSQYKNLAQALQAIPKSKRCA